MPNEPVLPETYPGYGYSPAPWTRLPYEAYQDYGFGTRPDGTNKGPGFLSIPLPPVWKGRGWGSRTASELSIDSRPGSPFSHEPLVYEGITPWDAELIREAESSFSQPMAYPGMRQVIDAADGAALNRAMRGLPPYWTEADGELPYQFTYSPRHP